MAAGRQIAAPDPPIQAVLALDDYTDAARADPSAWCGWVVARWRQLRREVAERRIREAKMAAARERARARSRGGVR